LIIYNKSKLLLLIANNINKNLILYNKRPTVTIVENILKIKYNITCQI